MKILNSFFKTSLKVIIVFSFFMSQQAMAQNVPINNDPPKQNYKYVIGVNAYGNTPQAFETYQHSPAQVFADRLVNSRVLTPYTSDRANLNQAINKAIEDGYRNIFIQRGQYLITGPITINVDNVTIEGESNLTILKSSSGQYAASPAFPTANSIFEITAKNCLIKNLSIDCFTQALSAIELKSGAENNTFRDINIENVIGTVTNQNFGAGAIYLNNTTSYIHNNVFDNIFMKLVNKGIVLNSVATADGIRHNVFKNIKMDRARNNNIEFIGSGMQPFRNTFEDFSIQVFVSQTNIVKDVNGNRNIFNRFRNADWKKATGWNTGAKAINLTSGAWATTITNFEMANYKVHAGSGVGGNTDDIDDQGKFTQLLYNERAGVMFSQLGYDGLNDGTGNNKSLMQIKGALILSAQANTSSNLNSGNLYNTAAAGRVLTCSDTEGRATWATITGTGGVIWDHKATFNVKLQNKAIINSATSDLPTSPGIRLDDFGNVRIGTTAPSQITTDSSPAKLQVDGKVIVGTTDASVEAMDPAYLLVVNGKVRVKNEIYVKGNDGTFSWPDYVFAKDHKLMPLQQVEQHIQQKGHLPNMPSAAEVEKDGIAVGDIIKRQQEKIEELTLYLIEMQKKIEALENNQKQ